MTESTSIPPISSKKPSTPFFQTARDQSPIASIKSVMQDVGKQAVDNSSRLVAYMLDKVGDVSKNVGHLATTNTGKYVSAAAVGVASLMLLRRLYGGNKKPQKKK